MKTFIALCLVLIAVAASQATQPLTDEQLAVLKKNYAECVSISGADQALIAKARKGDIAEGDPKLNAFFDCVARRSGFIDENGNLKTDVINRKIAYTDTDAVLAACGYLSSLPKNILAIETYKCYLLKSPVKINLLDLV